MFTQKYKVLPWKASPVWSKDGVDERLINVEGTQQPFETNAFGFPLNDIAALNGAKSVQEYQIILARLQEYVADNPDTSKMTTQQLIDSVMPHFAQTPAEIERAADWIGSRMGAEFEAKVNEIREQKAAVKAAAEAAKAKAAEPSVVPDINV